MHALFRYGLLTFSLIMMEVPLWAQAPREPSAMTRRVDELLLERLAAEKITPVEQTSDAEFLRRLTIDLTGRIPRVSEVRDFLASSEADRRAQLIDKLLAKPTHATHLANTWRSFLLPENADVVRFGGSEGFEAWLRRQFVDNASYDAIVRDIVLAKGQIGQGATLFYTALENKPEELAAATSRAFLGVQIQCAQCHDHPHDIWKQSDFWGYAAFFAQLQRPGTLPAQAALLADVDIGDVENPITKQVVPPKFLLGSVATPQANTTRREQLAAWLTDKRNPYFAKAAVNRCWALMFGRGLIDPVDDLGEHNPPSHPELLDELADYFVTTNYDLRNLLRVLANTNAYQRTSMLRDGETPSPPELYARMAIKTLSAEQLYDSLALATLRRDAMPAMNNPGQPNFDQTRAAFLEKFRAPAGNATEFHAGIPQALTLMNGPLVAAAIDLDQSPMLAAVSAPFFSNQQRVETLFLATLSRPPAPDEQAKFVSYLESRLTAAERQRALSDVLWALLNSAEFTLNH